MSCHKKPPSDTPFVSKKAQNLAQTLPGQTWPQQQHNKLRRYALRQYLDSSSKGNSFVRVDALGQLTPVKEVGKQALHLGDTGGSTNQHNVMHCTLVNLGILQQPSQPTQFPRTQVSQQQRNIYINLLMLLSQTEQCILTEPCRQSLLMLHA